MAHSSKSILIASDIHVGSKKSICTESPEVGDQDNPYNPNKFQKLLLKCWNSCIDRISQKPNVFVINGEPIDGANRASMGEGIWSTNLNDQLNDAEKLLKKVPYKELIFVRGSGYHVSRDATNFEETLAKKMGASKYRAYEGTGYTDYELNLKVFDKHINFTHHVGYSGWWQYRTTPIARELVKLHFAHQERGFHTDVAVRSHVHYYVEVRFQNTIGFSTPAWKFPDGFLYRRGIPELPTVGMMEVIVEPNGEIDVNPILAKLNLKTRVYEV